ncbi:myrosinase 1-like [Diorhabda sublineata]|uniref:myrosinase 1-like n=1 Tax=Diorhabda sublineata TaxID=1163346 RepID=UPI0024E0A2FC|nr:myrosinase 1-like [Diorhabda sublineata]
MLEKYFKCHVVYCFWHDKMNFIFILLVNSCLGHHYSNKRFPKDFMFGVATSAYQIEGAWNEDGKSENIWDYALHKYPNLTVDYTNGDVACDSYHNVAADVAILKELGVQHYRFSIPWTRILPRGFQSEINMEAVIHYQNFIKKLKKNGIEPMVTLYHWDLPQSLQNLGGFLNDSLPEWFVDYAKVCFHFFGSDVKYWITFNEPVHICLGGYGYGYFAPNIYGEALWIYRCIYNVLLAHARTWHLYDEEFRLIQKGKLAMSLNNDVYIPASNKETDIEAADRLLQFMLGIFANPLYVGDFPEIVKFRVAERSKAEGRTQSRLPELTQEEIAYIKGTSDFFAFNVYTAYKVADLDYEPPITNPPTISGDQGVTIFQPPYWENTTASFIKVVPWTGRYIFKWIKHLYKNPEIFVTENGYPTHGNQLDDRRIFYIKNYLNDILNSIYEDNITFLGYTVWSLMDNFQWNFGYTNQFGLYAVDFKSPNKIRTPRPSAGFYRRIIESRCLVNNCVD